MAKKSKKNKKKQQKQQQKQLDTLKNTEDTPNVVKMQMNSTPWLVKNVIGIGNAMKWWGIISVVTIILVAIILVMVGGQILFEDGWKDFVAYWVEFLTFWKLTDILQAVIVLFPFFLWARIAALLKKNYKERIFQAHTDKVCVEKKDGGKISLTYQELGAGIRNRKVHIGPDWIEIPYDKGLIHVSPDWIESPIQDGKICLDSQGKGDLVGLLKILSLQCDIPYNWREMEEILRIYINGWRITYWAGWPILLFGTHLIVARYVVVEYESIGGLVSVLLSRQNIMGIIGLVMIAIGYLIKFIYFMKLRSYFKPYKDYFHISW